MSEGQTASGNAVLHASIVGSGVGSPGSSDRKPLFFQYFTDVTTEIRTQVTVGAESDHHEKC